MTSITVHCAHCGAPKEVCPAVAGYFPRHFCNRDCVGLYKRSRRIIRNCANCGTPKELRPSESKSRKHVFCGVECNTAFRKGVSKYDFSQPINKVEVSCSHCGDLMMRRPGDVARFKTMFCSRKCFGAFNKGKAKGTNKISGTCRICGKGYETWPSRVKAHVENFCSFDCSKKALVDPRNHIPRKCATCGNEYSATLHQITKRGSRYCSKECQHAGSRTRRGAYGYYWRKTAEAVRQRDHNACRLCGVVQTYPKHCVHHIIPAVDFGLDRVEEANHPDNLITLCASCHPKAENNPDLIAAPTKNYSTAAPDVTD